MWLSVSCCSFARLMVQQVTRRNLTIDQFSTLAQCWRGDATATCKVSSCKVQGKGDKLILHARVQPLQNTTQHPLFLKKRQQD